MSKIGVSDNSTKLGEKRLSASHHFSLIGFIWTGAHGDSVVQIGNVVTNFSLSNYIVSILKLKV